MKDTSYRVAYWSPFPPLESGISDYSTDLIAALAKYCDLEIFTDNAALPPAFPHPGALVWGEDYYDERNDFAPFDVNIYNLGNNPFFHKYIYDRALSHPGIVLQHDMSLYDFHSYLWQNDLAKLLNEVRYNYGEQAAQNLQKLLQQHKHPDRLTYHLTKRIFDSSLSVVVHSQWSKEFYAKAYPNTQLYNIFHGADVFAAKTAAQLRRKFNFSENHLLIGAFGRVNHTKRIHVILNAFHALYKKNPNARLLIVGFEEEQEYVQKIKKQIKTLGLTNVVISIPNLDMNSFLEYVQCVDVVVNLRWPTSGETSGVMLRAFGAGKVVITSDLPQFREYDNTYCWRIEANTPHETQQLTQYLLKASDNPALVKSSGEQAREFIEQNASWDLMGQKLIHIVQDTLAMEQIDIKKDLSYWNPFTHVSGLNVIGDLRSETGLVTAAARLFDVLLGKNIPVSYREKIYYGADPKNPLPARFVGLPRASTYPINLFLNNINDMPWINDEELTTLTDNKYTIAFWAWELEKVADIFKDHIQRVSEIWVNSAFTKQNIEAYTQAPVSVIPMPISIETSDVPDRSQFHLPSQAFVFLFTFDANSCESRKNPLGVAQAFQKAFWNYPGKKPLLVIKSQNLENYPMLAKALKNAVENVGGMLIESYLTRRQMNDLLACCDAYVSLHRAEGFGLGMAEAMYLGKPVIATGYSGNADYMTAENSYPVDFTIRTITLEEHHYHPDCAKVYQPGFVWAEPNIDHAAQLMLHVFEHPEEARQKGAIAAKDIRRQYSAHAAATVIINRLNAIDAKPGLPSPVKATADTSEFVNFHQDLLHKWDWTRTRDQRVPFKKQKGIGTLLRIAVRVFSLGRLNEQQGAINVISLNEYRQMSSRVAELEAKLSSLQEQMLYQYGNQPMYSESTQKSSESANSVSQSQRQLQLKLQEIQALQNRVNELSDHVFAIKEKLNQVDTEYGDHIFALKNTLHTMLQEYGSHIDAIKEKLNQVDSEYSDHIYSVKASLHGIEYMQDKIIEIVGRIYQTLPQNSDAAGQLADPREIGNPVKNLSDYLQNAAHRKLIAAEIFAALNIDAATPYSISMNDTHELQIIESTVEDESPSVWLHFNIDDTPYLTMLFKSVQASLSKTTTFIFIDQLQQDLHIGSLQLNSARHIHIYKDFWGRAVILAQPEITEVLLQNETQILVNKAMADRVRLFYQDTPALNEIAQALPEHSIVIDVDAESGAYAMQMLTQTTHIDKAVLFEPHIYNAAVIRANIQSWQMQDKMIVFDGYPGLEFGEFFYEQQPKQAEHNHEAYKIGNISNLFQLAFMLKDIHSVAVVMLSQESQIPGGLAFLTQLLQHARPFIIFKSSEHGNKGMTDETKQFFAAQRFEIITIHPLVVWVPTERSDAFLGANIQAGQG